MAGLSPNNLSEPYKPKNILITGGCGFIGSHVVLHFVKKYPNCHIVNLDKLDYCASRTYLEEIESAANYTFIKQTYATKPEFSTRAVKQGGDILSFDLVMFALKTYNIDTILHFAAQSHVDNSFGNSVEFTRVNVLGTHVMLECAKAYGVKRFVHVSTDEVYGETAYKDGTSEEAILQPTNPYAATKAGAEHLVMSYYKSFQTPVIITRSNNIYGPHQYPEKVIPKFITLLSQGKPCPIHGKGTAKRSFLYIADLVKAFEAVVHRGDVGRVYNIASQVEITTLDLAEKLIALFGYTNPSQYITYVRDRAFNDLRYHIDGSKMLELDWKPVTSFDEGLRLTIEWYRTTDLKAVWPNVDIALTAHPSIQLSDFQSSL